MDIGLKHLFYAFAVMWVVHLGYLLHLTIRHNRLTREIEQLRKGLGSKDD